MAKISAYGDIEVGRVEAQVTRDFGGPEQTTYTVVWVVTKKGRVLRKIKGDTSTYTLYGRFTREESRNAAHLAEVIKRRGYPTAQVV